MMRLVGVLGVLALLATPVSADLVTYTFDVTAGGITLNLEGAGSTSSALGGWFQIEIDQSDCHIGEGDLATLKGSELTNTDAMALSIGGLASANVAPGSAQILGFVDSETVAIPAGGQMQIQTDAFLDATVVVSGAFDTTFTTQTSAGELFPLDVLISTSVFRSDVMTANLGFVFGYAVGIPDISMTITLDLILDVEGTAHVVPDPAFGGFTAMGLAGAGAWLRRRRS